jgi:hypothetical protein
MGREPLARTSETTTKTQGDRHAEPPVLARRKARRLET